jgi:hypothetical protein
MIPAGDDAFELMGEPVEVLSVGSVIGGSTPKSQAWRDGITELMLRVSSRVISVD